MTREIGPGIHWIEEFGPDRSGMVEEGGVPDWYDPGEETYIPQCAYLLVGSEKTLLFDTLSPASTDRIVESVGEILGDRSLDYLVVSHPDVPHAGNVPALLATFDAELVAPGYGNDHELYRLEDATHVVEGDSIDLGNLEAVFHEATFLDAPVSIWMTERTTETLFPVDWLGYPHQESESYRFADEACPQGIEPSRLVQFHGRVLFWFQYVDVPKVCREIDQLAAEYDPEMIAPAHGLVIREDAVEVIEGMKEVVRQVDEEGRVGVLG